MTTHPELRFLPARVRDATLPQIRQVVAREGDLADERLRVLDEIERMIDTLHKRAPSDETTLGEVATPEEAGHLEALDRRSGELGAACEAINAYMAPLASALAEFSRADSDPDGEA